MKKIIALLAVVSAFVFVGCEHYTAGRWTLTPTSSRVDYDGRQFGATLYRHPDSTTDKLHVVGEVAPKEGATELPKIEGTLVDTANGGKRLDLYIGTN